MNRTFMNLALVGIGLNIILIPLGLSVGAADVSALGLVNTALCFFGYWANKRILSEYNDGKE